jgi:hypothetical protein
MKTFNLAAAIGVAVLTMVVASPVVTRADDKDDVMMTGTIVSIDGEKYTIRVPEGDRIFKFKEGVAVPPNLAPGTQVTMWIDEDDVDDNPPGEKVESETYTIHRISVGAPGGTGMADTSRTMTPPTPAPAAPVTPPVTPAPVAPQATAPPAQPMTELPQTASPLYAVGVLGFLFFAGGIGMTIWSWRRAS